MSARDELQAAQLSSHCGTRWKAASKKLRRLDAGNEASLYAMLFIGVEDSNGFVNDAFMETCASCSLNAQCASFLIEVSIVQHNCFTAAQALESLASFDDLCTSRYPNA
eukprot:2090-Heterococcus_DN1.PRE.3